LILLVLLQRALPGLRLGAALGPFLLRVLPAAALMGGLVWLAWHLLLGPYAGGALGLLLAVMFGGLLYAGLLQLLGVPESRAAVRLLKARLGR
jgi:hypothetical protein